MTKQLLSFLLLLLYMNTALLPHVQEDPVCQQEVQRDDINTLTEWIGVITGFDQTADDEDGQTGQQYCACNPTIAINVHYMDANGFISPINTALLKQEYSFFALGRTASISLDRFSPPPEA